MMKLRTLRLPKGLNIEFLLRFMSEEELMVVIADMADKPRSERKVVLPSRSCMRKCLIFYLGEKYHQDFRKVMDVLRDNGSVLASHGHYISNVKRLYQQRKKEIENEQ